MSDRDPPAWLASPIFSLRLSNLCESDVLVDRAQIPEKGMTMSANPFRRFLRPSPDRGLSRSRRRRTLEFSSMHSGSLRSRSERSWRATFPSVARSGPHWGRPRSTMPRARTLRSAGESPGSRLTHPTRTPTTSPRLAVASGRQATVAGPGILSPITRLPFRWERLRSLPRLPTSSMPERAKRITRSTRTTGEAFFVRTTPVPRGPFQMTMALLRAHRVEDRC